MQGLVSTAGRLSKLNWTYSVSTLIPRGPSISMYFCSGAPKPVAENRSQNYNSLSAGESRPPGAGRRAPVPEPAGGAEVGRVLWGGRRGPSPRAVWQKLCWVSSASPAQASVAGHLGGLPVGGLAG